jgi:hypothetical protein
MEETGLGWAGLIGVAGGVAGVGSFFVALLVWLGPSRREVREDLADDPIYRADIAASLRDGSLGRRYRGGLAGGLGLLDRAFGPPGSAAALGVCFIIALVYAYVGFFLVLGLGGPGVVGGFPLLSEAAEQPQRLGLGAFLALLPLGGFWLGRRLGRPIRRLEWRLVSGLQRAISRRGRRMRRRISTVSIARI